MLALVAGSSLWAGDVIVNGGFSSANFPAGTCTVGTTCNFEFDNNYAAGANLLNYSVNGTVVSSWTATGYSIYFVAGQQTTQSAIGRWTSTNKEMLGATATTLSPTGGNFVGLDSDPTIGSSVSQTVNLALNQYYTLTYYWAAAQLQSKTGITNESVQVSLGALGSDVRQSVNAVTALPAQGFSGWFKETVTFQANSTSEVLKFLGKSTSTCLPPMVLIDGVSLIQNVPEPAALTMLGLGSGLVLLAARRRRR